MRDLLLPMTDAGVLVQAVVLALVVGLLLALTRHHRDLRPLVVGAGVLLTALFLLRAAH